MGFFYSIESPQLGSAIYSYPVNAQPTYSYGVILPSGGKLGFSATITTTTDSDSVTLSLPLPATATIPPLVTCSISTAASSGSTATGSVLCDVANKDIGTGFVSFYSSERPLPYETNYGFYVGTPTITVSSMTTATVTSGPITVPVSTVTTTKYNATSTVTPTTTLTGVASTQYSCVLAQSPSSISSASTSVVTSNPPSSSPTSLTTRTTTRGTTTRPTASPTPTAGVCNHDDLFRQLQRDPFAHVECLFLLGIIPHSLPDSVAKGPIGHISSACSCYEKSRTSSPASTTTSPVTRSKRDAVPTDHFRVRGRRVVFQTTTSPPPTSAPGTSTPTQSVPAQTASTSTDGGDDDDCEDETTIGGTSTVTSSTSSLSTPYLAGNSTLPLGTGTGTGTGSLPTTASTSTSSSSSPSTGPSSSSSLSTTRIPYLAGNSTLPAGTGTGSGTGTGALPTTTTIPGFAAPVSVVPAVTTTVYYAGAAPVVIVPTITAGTTTVTVAGNGTLTVTGNGTTTVDARTVLTLTTTNGACASAVGATSSSVIVPALTLTRSAGRSVFT